MPTFAEFVKQHGITAVTEWQSEGEHRSQKYRVTLKYFAPAGTNGYSVATPTAERFDWTAGSAIVTGKYTPIKTLHDEEMLRAAATRYKVNPADVLQCLALDSSAVDSCFEDWAAEYGYDPDSRSAEIGTSAAPNATPKPARGSGGLTRTTSATCCGWRPPGWRPKFWSNSTAKANPPWCSAGRPAADRRNSR